MVVLQKNLFDLDLKFSGRSGVEVFADSSAERLKRLVWSSGSRQDFYYDDLDNRRLALVSLVLKGLRRLKKNGRFEFVLERRWSYSGLEECIDDEVCCSKIEDLEGLFEDEKSSFEVLRALPSDVLFDGRRYCWRFRKNDDGAVVFIEKWLPEIKDDDEDGIKWGCAKNGGQKTSC